MGKQKLSDALVVRMTEAQRGQVRAHAAKHDVTEAAWIRSAIAAGLEAEREYESFVDLQVVK